MSAMRFPELDALTRPLPTLAQLVARRAEQLAMSSQADDWVIQIDGQWHRRRAGRAPGSTSVSADSYPTKQEALDEVLAESRRAARRAARLMEGGSDATCR